MARVYATACERFGRNFNTVPKGLKDEVKTIIENDGFVINDDGTVSFIES